MMKKLILLSIAALSLNASGENRTMLIYHDDAIDPFFFSEIEHMSLGFDNNGRYSQFIHTPDSVYSYPVENIDSIAFQQIPTIIKPEVTLLSEDLSDYILGSEDTGTGCNLFLSPSTPSQLVPKRRDLLLQIEASEKLPSGFAGEVSWIHNNDDRIIVECYGEEPFRFFDQLSYVGNAEFKAAEDSHYSSRSALEDNVPHTLPKLEENFMYPENPYVSDGVIYLTEELKDIPAGPAKGVLEGMISLKPKISCMVGVYVLPFPDGEIVQKRRLRTSVSTEVYGMLSGRYAIDDKAKHTVAGEKKKFVLPLGIGQTVAVTFNGSMVVEGEGGIDYVFNGGFASEGITDVAYDEWGDMLSEMKVTHSTTKPLLRELSALMDKSVTLSATLSFISAQSGDTLKAISNTYTYGSTLKGNAIYKKSKLDGVDKSTDLYQRLTSTGIKASSIENVTGAVKYAYETFNLKPKTEANPTIAFYAVPKFSHVSYDKQSHEFSYKVEGTPMKFAHSSLGLAWRKTDDSYSFYPTEMTWPFNCLSNYSTTAPAGYDEKGFIYPTTTLPDGTLILATPQYPVHNGMAPIYFTLSQGDYYMTGGAIATGGASDNGRQVHVGNLFPVISKDKKK